MKLLTVLIGAINGAAIGVAAGFGLAIAGGMLTDPNLGGLVFPFFTVPIGLALGTTFGVLSGLRRIKRPIAPRSTKSSEAA